MAKHQTTQPEAKLITPEQIHYEGLRDALQRELRTAELQIEMIPAQLKIIEAKLEKFK